MVQKKVWNPRFEDFYRAEYERAFRAAYLFSGDREMAFDATQEAFMDAFAKWKSLSKEPWAAAWVMTAAMNRCRGSWRRIRREMQLLAAMEGVASTTQSLDTDHVDLVSALRQLPPRQRQATVLYYVADLPVAVVADRLGVSEGTIKAHLSQARHKLRLAMGVKYV